MIVIILSLIPVCLIFDGYNESNSIIAISILKLLRIINYKNVFIILKFLERKSMKLIRILKAMLLYYASAHFFGCMFIHISTFHSNYERNDTWIKRIAVRETLP